MIAGNIPCLTTISKLENDFYLVNQKNVLTKITDKENCLKFKLYEKEAQQTLLLTFETDSTDCGLFGSECCNRYDCQKAVDFCYMYIVSKDKKAFCYICDLKKTVGNGVEVIQHLVEQWMSSIRYVKSVCAYYFVNIERIFLSVVSTMYNEDGIKRFIEEYTNAEQNINQSKVPTFIQNKAKKNIRYIPGMLPVLERFFRREILFENQIYQFEPYVSAGGEYSMSFVNGILQ
ncbi:hypothetical protein B7990_05560 [Fibrobacter sp. UWB4]|uniref:hypothetical protein n=1 Tax=Fibrobacter sp. UWB4 TaxID=1964356 RepID=UPI000B52810B|nr:hypothetical protein [Fibrobacter sp. UWB4]OWV18740.1 hypothetical protein B7990_05560 [Fibrobacter sp. UWB4]